MIMMIIIINDNYVRLCVCERAKRKKKNRVWAEKEVIFLLLALLKVD